MIEVKLTDDKQFPIDVIINSGKKKFTYKAAIELRDKLSMKIDKYFEINFNESLKESKK